ncbi:RidA family protein [Salinibacterium hongtaonis]|uniref:Reactive intermediate/imine deaminase n=1 Tax=Homoserinimonas hongtaonis TaxID=2079791 RepID=A0A2U1SZ67_9MICO|nr:RidA family protein [Salinibacterium hongtaonis]PWB96925.1 reactive intermediate/imine deaminase [Salinibacterium hongtaonis]
MTRFSDVPALGEPRGAYSFIAEAGGLVFSAGIGPFTPDNAPLSSDAAEQTESVIDNIESALAVVGLGLGDVVKVTVMVQNFAADFAAVTEVYGRRFPQPYPVRTVFGADLPGPLVAMDVTAVRPAAQ